MTEERVREALAGLPSMSTVFGKVIEARASGSQPDSFILHMLEMRHQLLEWWEIRARKYREIIGNPETAIAGLHNELLGFAKASSRSEFDGRLRDAIAEVCAVVELSLRGGTDFKRIQPPGYGQKAPDFECLLKDDIGGLEPYCVEVKNFRAPLGILDFFKALYDERAKSTPQLLNRSIQLSHYWDNTVTDDHKCIITECFNRLSNCDLPFETTFNLDDDGAQVEVKVRVREGRGVSLQRGVGGSMDWGPFTKTDRFYSHAAEKIRKGVEQLRTRSDRKSLLVLNVESPDGTLDSDVVLKLREIVLAESSGAVEGAFLFQYCWLE